MNYKSAHVMQVDVFVQILPVPARYCHPAEAEMQTKKNTSVVTSVIDWYVHVLVCFFFYNKSEDN